MRKTKVITLIDDGQTLTFRLTQMPATKAERFTNRLLALLVGSGSLNNIDVKKLQKLGESGGIAEILSLLSKLDYDKVEPLYNELLDYCEHIPDGNAQGFGVKQSQETIDSVIGDFKNLYKLRFEILKLNYGFFTNGQNAQSQKAADITFAKTTKM